MKRSHYKFRYLKNPKAVIRSLQDNTGALELCIFSNFFIMPDAQLLMYHKSSSKYGVHMKFVSAH